MVKLRTGAQQPSTRGPKFERGAYLSTGNRLLRVTGRLVKGKDTIFLTEDCKTLTCERLSPVEVDACELVKRATPESAR